MMSSKIHGIRLKVADRLDSNPNYCWANLVLWALGYCDSWVAWLWPYCETNGIESKLCVPDGTDGCWSYCGKCANMRK